MTGGLSYSPTIPATTKTKQALGKSSDRPAGGMVTGREEHHMITIQFSRERETKNTVRYTEEIPANDADATPVVGTLYVSKRALQKLGNPDRLTVTIALTK